VPTPPLPDDVRALLAEANPAVIATARADGQPVTVVTWYLLDGENIVVNLDRSRARLRHLRADPRVALTVLDKDWYTHISIVGHVVRIATTTCRASIGSPPTTRANRIRTGRARGSMPGLRSTVGTAGGRPAAHDREFRGQASRAELDAAQVLVHNKIGTPEWTNRVP